MAHSRCDHGSHVYFVQYPAVCMRLLACGMTERSCETHGFPRDFEIALVIWTGDGLGIILFLQVEATAQSLGNGGTRSIQKSNKTSQEHLLAQRGAGTRHALFRLCRTRRWSHSRGLGASVTARPQQLLSSYPKPPAGSVPWDDGTEQASRSGLD